MEIFKLLHLLPDSFKVWQLFFWIFLFFADKSETFQQNLFLSATQKFNAKQMASKQKLYVKLTYILHLSDNGFYIALLLYLT